MSFSKAKLQRFNEIKDYSPSPAKYNVADIQNKWIRGGFFTKSGRFTRKDSPTRSDSESVMSTPCFQTPNAIPKKKKSLTRSLTKSMKSNNNKEQLQEKIVECNNKDIYINELTEQLDELKITITKIKDDNEMKMIENQLLNDEIKQLKLNCHQYLNDIEMKSNENRNITNELKQIRIDYKGLQQKNNNDMQQVLENLNKFELLYNKTIDESRNMLEIKEKEHVENLDKIQKQYDDDLKILIEKLENQHQDYSKKIGEIEGKQRVEIDDCYRIINEKDARILLLEENFNEINLLAEIQTTEKIDEIVKIWQMRLNETQNEHDLILKECQDISEYNIIQTELEKNQLKTELMLIEQNYQQLMNKYEQLQIDNENKHKQIQKYQITTKTNLDTIDVITKRLIDSDRDVEQFKDELKHCEIKLVNYENIIIDLKKQLDDYRIENDELEMQYESTLKTTQDQIETTQTALIEKVDSFERIINEQLDKYTQQQQQFDQIYQQLHQQQDLNQQSQILIEQANKSIENHENTNSVLCIKNQQLEELINGYRNKMALYENEIDETNEIRKKYIDISGKYDEMSHNYEQLEAKLKDIEIERSALTHEYQQLNRKYVDIISHQNNKQKIKHICSLKTDTSELFQHNVDLQKENNRLVKIIEKLNRDMNDLKKPNKKSKYNGNKENLLSPNRLLATRTDSPGPLKEVN